MTTVEDYARAVDENEEDSTVYQLKYQPTKSGYRAEVR